MHLLLLSEPWLSLRTHLIVSLWILERRSAFPGIRLLLAGREVFSLSTPVRCLCIAVWMFPFFSPLSLISLCLLFVLSRGAEMSEAVWFECCIHSSLFPTAERPEPTSLWISAPRLSSAPLAPFRKWETDSVGVAVSWKGRCNPCQECIMWLKSGGGRWGLLVEPEVL